MSSTPIYHKPTFEHISEQKRARVMCAAINEFATCGYDNANINTIAKRAGVSVGSLYKYFDTKVELFLTAVHSGIATLEQVIMPISESDEDVMLKLERILRAALDFSRKQQVLIMLYNEITSESNGELVRRLSRDMEAVAARVYIDAIKQGQRTGEIRADIDAGLAAFLLDNMIMGIQFSYACDYYTERYKLYAGDDIFSRDDFAVENFLSFIRAALKPNSTSNT